MSKKVFSVLRMLAVIAILTMVAPLSIFAAPEEGSSPTPTPTSTEAAAGESAPSALPEDESPTADTTKPEDAPKEGDSTKEAEATKGKAPETKVLSVTDISALSADPTLHVEVVIEDISYGLGTHPTFELTLGDKDLNLIAKVEGSATNYNTETGRYNLVFPLKSKLIEGETYYILLSSASPEIRDMEY